MQRNTSLRTSNFGISFGGCFNCGFGFRHHHHHFFFGGAFLPVYYPYYPYSYGPIFPPDVYYNQAPMTQPVVIEAQGNNELAAQVESLADQVARMREEEAYRAGQAARAAAPSSRSSATTDQTPTVLIFRDGSRKEVKNYGIVGKTLWAFDERKATKIPIDDLDVDATRKANDERGVEFSVPKQ